MKKHSLSKKKSNKIVPAIVSVFLLAVIIILILIFTTNPFTKNQDVQMGETEDKEDSELEVKEESPSKETPNIENHAGNDIDSEPSGIEEGKIDEQVVIENEDEVKSENKAETDDNGYIIGQTLPSEPTFINGILIANKKYPLPKNYNPGESVEARAAYEEMANAASEIGFELTAFSTYRSFEYQRPCTLDMLIEMVKIKQIAIVLDLAILNTKQG